MNGKVINPSSFSNIELDEQTNPKHKIPISKMVSRKELCLWSYNKLTFLSPTPLLNLKLKRRSRLDNLFLRHLRKWNWDKTHMRNRAKKKKKKEPLSSFGNILQRNPRKKTKSLSAQTKATWKVNYLIPILISATVQTAQTLSSTCIHHTEQNPSTQETKNQKFHNRIHQQDWNNI